jgi:Big-like domain-containing protein
MLKAIPAGPLVAVLMVLLSGTQADAGKWTASTTTVSVSAPSPATGAVTVAGKATAKKLARLEVYVDGNLKATCAATPCDYPWNTRASANGAHTLVAKRYDVTGAVTTSAPLSVLVNNDVTAPVVSVTAPAVAVGTVLLSALATDASGVTTTQLYLDGALVASAAGGTVTYTWNTTTASNSTHTVQAKGTDPSGNVGSSGVASVTVSNTSSAPAPVPVTYTADSSRTVYPVPTLPSIGPAGSQFTDPTFGSALVRITDAHTRPDRPNRSYFGPSSAEQNTWNADSTLFYVEGGGGEILPYKFNPATRVASRLGDTGNGSGGVVLLMGEASFSFTDPNVLYGIAGSNGRTLIQYSFATGTNASILNLDTLIPGLSGYTGSISVSADGLLATYFGGPAQDAHFYVVVVDPDTGAVHLLNTQTGTIDGGLNADIPWNWFIHNARLDKSGRYVVITPAGGAPVGLVVWDIVTGHAAQVSPAGGGHKVSGYGVLINNDVLPGHTWDTMQWLLRPLDLPNLGVVAELISPVLSPSGSGDTHLSWNHAQPDTLVPVVISTYRLPADTTPWRAWDNEIVAVRTDGGVSTVWRFAHHRSRVAGFWDMPRGNVSQDGRWFLFTSNWDGTLGLDETGTGPRDDAFVLELAAP